jgi:hypothetical protein
LLGELEFTSDSNVRHGISFVGSRRRSLVFEGPL